MSKSKFVAAAALLAASSGAFAAITADNTNIGSLTGTYTTTVVESNPGILPNTAIDGYQFSLPSNGGVFGDLAALTITIGPSIYGDTNISWVGLWDNTSFTAIAPTALDLNAKPITYTFDTLSTGHDYYFQLKYTGSGIAAGYQLNMTPTVAAVPEPETYGMMALGLGVLGFIGRRRKQQQA
jgi:PEP-CTERM motif